ncbi:MAG: SMC-Scp complex subunit ScpB [Mariniblastus sp.]
MSDEIIQPSDQLDDSQPGSAAESEEPKWADDAQSKMRRLEAVLFMSRQPIPSRKLSQLAHLEDGTQARTMTKELNAHYDRVGRAFHIKRVAGGYQLRTRPQFADWIGRLDHVPRGKRLSSPALETLTVVAYRQPIIKADIEAIRGVSCGEMLRQLLENGLIKIAGRSEQLGRPFLYATSKEFLAQYGLNNLNDLPRAKQLCGNGLPEWASSDDNPNPIFEQKSETSEIDAEPISSEDAPLEKLNTSIATKLNGDADSPTKEDEE